jgi:ribosomal protein S18 acetylase RimI-like enzyme
VTGDSRAVTLLDWRHADAELLQPCYGREYTYWRDVLAWDTGWTWTTVEEARVTWGLPGLIALDPAGRLRGWSFYLVEERALRIGALVADTAEARRAIVARLVEQGRSDRLDLVSCFIAERTTGLRAELEAEDFECETFHYLQCDLAGDRLRPERAADDAKTCERWDGDAVAAADLLASAYQHEAALHFTSGGTVEEWRTYVRLLIEQPACGTLDADGTLMVRDRAGLAALALVTNLASETAHLAQMAVRPDCRGRGVARRLLDAVLRLAAARGRTTMTLLVGETNHHASRLYAQAGFQPRAFFLAGRLPFERGDARGGRLLRPRT